jgi:SAM-dependent methyltransferase
MLDWEFQEITRFMDEAMQRFSPGDRAGKRLLDFGCGSGKLVGGLAERGYAAAEGCDIKTYWDTGAPVASRLSVISFNPYRLPYDDHRFDVVISTSVLEHAQNKEELFQEIHRVLKPGGVAIHLYPSKWYMPTEPHIFVPLVNVFWPRCPKWWLSLWAWAGIRNDYQKQMPWREVSATNAEYCRDGLTYWSHAAYRKLSMAVFGHYSDETTYFVQHGYGGAAKGLRRLPIPASLAGAICSTLRMSLLVNVKPAASR